MLIVLTERTLGGIDVFLPYIKEYVNTFTGKSISADQWKEHLYDYYRRNNLEKVKLLDTVDWQVSLYTRLNNDTFLLYYRLGSTAKERNFLPNSNMIQRLRIKLIIWPLDGILLVPRMSPV